MLDLFAALPALFVGDFFGVFETLNELHFVVQVMVFSYLLFWCYLTFRDAQVLFGLAAIVFAYVIFVHGLSITVLTLLFLVFVVMGTHIQMILDFGLFPLLGMHRMGGKLMREQHTDPAELQQRIQSGQASQAEIEAFQEMATQEQFGRTGSAERRMMG